MREIEYRAWEIEFTEEGERYGGGFHYSEETEEKRACGFSFYTDSGHQNSDYIFELYTGMKDIFKEKIFEGDIIRGLFDFGPGGFHERVLPVHFDNTQGYNWNYWKLDTIEVIGNIHQDSDLLKKAQ